MSLPTTFANAPIERALVVAAHPDDIDFGVAGTVAAWTAAGVDVRYCLCTSGEAGGAADVPDAELRAVREGEQRAAAAEVGVKDLTFLRYPDGRLTVSLDLRRDIAREIRRVRPQVVIGNSPEIDWARPQVSHPDHRAAGECTFAAVYPDARNPRAFPALLDEGLQPWTVAELWMHGAPRERADHAVDVTDTVEAKLAALAAHRSQIAAIDELAPRIRHFLAGNAQRHGMPDGRQAEAFQVISFR